jgi:hypothetical protein
MWHYIRRKVSIRNLRPIYKLNQKAEPGWWFPSLQLSLTDCRSLLDNDYFKLDNSHPTDLWHTRPRCNDADPRHQGNGHESHPESHHPDVQVGVKMLCEGQCTRALSPLASISEYLLVECRLPHLKTRCTICRTAEESAREASGLWFRKES